MHLHRSLQAELLIAALSKKGFKLDEAELSKSSAAVPNRKFTDARKLAAAKKKAAKRGR